MLKNRKAFTLAETLITLTIIGVIAAMTVPTLMTNYQKQTYVTGLKKAYSQFKTAMQMVPIAEGCSAGDYTCAFNTNNRNQIFSYEIANGEDLATLAKQFNIVKKTTAGETKECQLLLNASGGAICYYTADGMMFGSSGGWGPEIVVDVNSHKGPNVFGRDRFSFIVAHGSSNGIAIGTIVPMGSKQFSQLYNSSYDYSQHCTSTNIKNKNRVMANCTGKVLREGKMDY